MPALASCLGGRSVTRNSVAETFPMFIRRFRPKTRHLAPEHLAWLNRIRESGGWLTDITVCVMLGIPVDDPIERAAAARLSQSQRHLVIDADVRPSRFPSWAHRHGKACAAYAEKFGSTDDDYPTPSATGHVSGGRASDVSALLSIGRRR